MKRFLFFLLILCEIAAETPLPRKVIAIYDKRLYEDLFFTKIHQLAEMPLNHLGLVVNYWDVYEELPDAGGDPEVVGAILWFNEATDLPEEVATTLLSWLIQLMESGKRVVLLGHSPFESSRYMQGEEEVNRFWTLLGLYDIGKTVTNTLSSGLIVNDPLMIRFERDYPKPIPSYRRLAPKSDAIEVALAAEEGSDTSTLSCLIVTGPKGGFVAEGYENLYAYGSGDPARFWYINPFRFFRKAFGIDFFPALDTTTVAGRRLFYSHIDGDGWNNMVQIREFQSPGMTAAELLAKEILEPHPEIPVTIAPIAADIDSSWFGTKRSEEALQMLLKLPHVELGNHTFTHPFSWRFFTHYTAADEEPYLYRYPGGSWRGRGLVAWARVAYDSWGAIEEKPNSASSQSGKRLFDEAYDVPRAYALKPFDPRMEVFQANDVIEKAAGDGRRPKLYQWSGDCLPFIEMFTLLEEAKLPNINGGDNRFDEQFPSYSWVRPKGRELGAYRQIYASNSNENTYTNYWRGNFFAFNRLPQTIVRTESPIRVLPVNLYYHVYSTEKLPGLEALKQNIAYIKSLPLIPLRADEYVQIAEGFYKGKIFSLGENRFRVEERGLLSTVRFDNASNFEVDFSQSKGVVGSRYLHGSLYVYLDEAEEKALIALKEGAGEGTFSLIESSMRIFGVERRDQSVRFKALGLGERKMVWQLPREGIAHVTIGGKEQALQSARKNLTIEMEGLNSEVTEVSIRF